MTLAARDGEVELVVTDRGPGVAPENRERLFRRYSRAERAGESGVGGLGLSVVAWVTQRHGGRVRLLDASHGAAFQVILPGLALEDRPPAALEAPPVGAGR